MTVKMSLTVRSDNTTTKTALSVRSGHTAVHMELLVMSGSVVQMWRFAFSVMFGYIIICV